MQRENSIEIKEVGIDFITATTAGRARDKSVDALGKILIEDEVKRGQPRCPWRGSGYRGTRAGSVAEGRRHDGGVLRVAGSLAAEMWPQIVSLATNVSRLDLQVTVSRVPNVGQLLSNNFQRAKRLRAEKKQRLNYKMIVGPDGPESLMLGSRSSDRYGRVYDKGKESQSKEYSACVRYEVELKNQIAMSMAHYLDSQDEVESRIASYVASFVRDYGFELPAESTLPLINWAGVLAGMALVRLKGYKDSGREKMWLRHCIRPMVQRLVAAGELAEALEALGLDKFVTVGNHGPEHGPTLHQREETTL